LTAQAFQLRSLQRYARHPIETALQHLRAHTEALGEEGNGGADFQRVEGIYRSGAQGLRLSEIPKLPESLRELSRIGVVDRAGRKVLRKWVEEHVLVFDESDFLTAWEEQCKRGGAEHHVYHDQDQGRWFKRLYHSINHSTLGDYFDRMRLHGVIFPETAYRLEGYFAYLHPVVGVLAHDLHNENVVRVPGSDALAVIDPFISLARRGTWAAFKLEEIGLPPPLDESPSQ